MCKHNWKKLTPGRRSVAVYIIEWCRKCGVIKKSEYCMDRGYRSRYYYPRYRNPNPERELTKVSNALKKVYRKPLEEALS